MFSTQPKTQWEFAKKEMNLYIPYQPLFQRDHLKEMKEVFYLPEMLRKSGNIGNELMMKLPKELQDEIIEFKKVFNWELLEQLIQLKAKRLGALQKQLGGVHFESSLKLGLFDVFTVLSQRNQQMFPILRQIHLYFMSLIPSNGTVESLFSTMGYYDNVNMKEITREMRTLFGRFNHLTKHDLSILPDAN